MAITTSICNVRLIPLDFIRQYSNIDGEISVTARQDKIEAMNIVPGSATVSDEDAGDGSYTKNHRFKIRSTFKKERYYKKLDTMKVIIGVPMMGMAITNLNRPIAKSYNALLCMTEDPVEYANSQMTNCIRCGRCVRACPVGLVPQMLAVASNRKDLARFEKLHGMDCIQCGSCTYICPAKRPLMQMFKVTRAAVMAERAKAREGKK